MKAVIVYESLHGSTEKCAKILSTLIHQDIELIRLRDHEGFRPGAYDLVIVGGSIHHGVIHSRIEKFLRENHHELLSRNLGLFLCCMEEGETARKEFESAYSEDLRSKALATGIFGGELKLDKMNFFEKKITRKITGIKSSVSKINEEEIRLFADKINRVIG